MSYKALIVDDEPSLIELIKGIAERLGLKVITAKNGKEAVDKALNENPDMVFMDIYMPELDGLEALEIIKESKADMPIVLITAFGNVDLAMKAIQQGAFDYLVKPSSVDEIRSIFKNVIHLLDNRRTERRCDDKQVATIVGISAQMQNVFKTVSKIAKTDATVLITGESGSGKQLVAETIHKLSDKNMNPFIQVDCTAFPEPLIESELFGHVKGAFTGAESSKLGKFELANNGTIFLDEIGELPVSAQSKLLRVLQEKEITKVGGTNPTKLDVRVVVATNRNLEDMVEKGEFRLDLYHRLKVIHIHVAPLRERTDDIQPLIEHFATLFSIKHKLDRYIITDRFIEWAKSYNWPGNARELRNTVERMVLLSNGIIDVNEISQSDISEINDHSREEWQTLINKELDRSDLKEIMKKFEKEVILSTLDKFNQNRSHSSKALGISRRALLYKLKESGISEE